MLLFAVKTLLSLASTLVIAFLLVLLLTIVWRAYKTVLVRRVKFLRNRHLKPVDAKQAILITGATSGIGLALAKHLLEAGYSLVATCYDSNERGHQELTDLKALKERAGARQKLLLVELDVTQLKSIEQAYEQVSSWLDRNKLQLYGLINNAGLGSLQPFAWLQRRNIKRLVDTNILGCLLVTRQFLPLLIRSNQESRLLSVSSGLGFIPGAGYAVYGASKCAAIYLTKCMNLELLERYKVRSVAVIPHNFIKNTNICNTNVQSNTLAWDEMNLLERSLYKQEFDEHLKLAKSLEEATKRLAKQSRNDLSAADKKSLSSSLSPSTRAIKGPSASTSSDIFRLPKEFLTQVSTFLQHVKLSLNGENIVSTIEESGVLECFEDALRLRDPPEHIFAGDTIFQLIIGSILLSLPHSCSGLLSKSVVSSLYK